MIFVQMENIFVKKKKKKKKCVSQNILRCFKYLNGEQSFAQLEAKLFHLIS